MIRIVHISTQRSIRLRVCSKKTRSMMADGSTPNLIKIKYTGAV